MISQFDYRLWIFFSCFIALQCISNKLVPIQIVHGFSPVESDRLGGDHLKQHQHQTLGRGHDFHKNTQQHVKTPFGEIRSHSSSSSSISSSSAKGLATADNIAISDVLSNEQMLYFSNENGNDNVKEKTFNGNEDFDMSEDDEFDSSSSSSGSISTSSNRDDGSSSSSGRIIINRQDDSQNDDNNNNLNDETNILRNSNNSLTKSDDLYVNDEPPPKMLPLRPIIRGPYSENGDDDDHSSDTTIVYTEQHTEVKLNCEVDLDIAAVVWMHNGQLVHTTERTSRPTDNRFLKEARGSLTITNAMLEDDGKWQCEAENAKGYIENGRLIQLVVLDRPKAPYLLIDSRRLDAGNSFVPVKENSELTLACISEGGNPKPILSWEVLISPGVDRHSQKVSADVLELQEIKNEQADKEPYKISSGAKSEAKLPAVYRAHHNARILCVMEHPTLKTRLNSSLLLDVQYTPSFAISRTPGFGYPLREGIEVSLKCDVDSNPPSTPIWQKDDGDPPIPQNGDGFLNFTQIRREHSGWYKCTSRHLNFQYSSIGYFLNIRYDNVDVTSEPVEQEVSVGSSLQHTTNKNHQLEVQLGGTVTLQCPQGSLGCWSHLDPINQRLRGLGMGSSAPTGIFSLKDVVYQDAGAYKCVGQSPTNKKKLDVLHTLSLNVKGAPTVSVRNQTPAAYPGSPLHLSVEFCANPPAYAARWLHGDRVYTPGNQYGIDVLAYGVIDLPTPFCKEARLTYVHMHERVPRTFYFIVSSPNGLAEAQFHINYTRKRNVLSNSIDGGDEELRDPEEIHFPVFGRGHCQHTPNILQSIHFKLVIVILIIVNIFCSNIF